MYVLRLVSVISFLAASVIPLGSHCDELSFRLNDLDGNPISLEKNLESHLTVVCFIGTECPLAKLYSGRLDQLAEKFSDVDFIAVSSNQQDSIADLKKFRERFRVSIPIVKDIGNRVADQFNSGSLLACVTSRPGQSGRLDGYILEGKELEFYVKKLEKKKK